MGGGNNDSSMIPDILGSATAGIISRLLTHPLDTAKSRLQAIYIDAHSTTTNNNPNKNGSAKASPFFRAATSTNPYRGPLDVLVQTFRTEGISGLYRGFGAVIVGGTPGTVLYLCGYEVAKNKLAEQWESRTHLPLEQSGGDFFVHFAVSAPSPTTNERQPATLTHTFFSSLTCSEGWVNCRKCLLRHLRSRRCSQGADAGSAEYGSKLKRTRL
jgi:hypothetical protein